MRAKNLKVYVNEKNEIVLEGTEWVLDKEETQKILEAVNGEIIRNDVENYPKEPGFYWCKPQFSISGNKNIIVEVIEDEDGDLWFVKAQDNVGYDLKKASNWSNKIMEEKK